MTTTLITGANRGLGLATAHRLVKAGHTVYLGGRNLQAAQQSAATTGGRALELDVTDPSSVAAAARQLQADVGQLDVLVNNAGVISAEGFTLPDVEETERIFTTNVFGTVRVTQAMLPLLLAAPHPRVINVGSGMGSFGIVTNPARHEPAGVVPAYAASKAALHMLTLQYATALPAVEINAVDPGYTATDMTGGRGHPIDQGIDAIVRLATHGNEGRSGTLLDRHGPLPW